MAKVFLDTNYFIDAIHRQPEKQILDSLEGNIVYISPLSLHIYCYIYKLDMPNKIVTTQTEKFELVDLTLDILDRSLKGPVKDLEDNIQLNSAAKADCDLFLTNDEALLKLKFFGRTEIVQGL